MENQVVMTHEIEQERPQVTNYKILFGLKIL